MTKPDMRERLLDACWEIILERGFASATTKNIAARAGVAEGSIYRHFPDKTELMIALVLERAGDVKAIFRKLLSQIGQNSPFENLAAAMRELFAFYERLQWISAGMFLDTSTMTRMHASLKASQRGPNRAHEAFAAYLGKEIEAGRLDGSRPPEILASILLGALHERAFLNAMTGREMKAEEKKAYVEQVISALFQASP